MKYFIIFIPFLVLSCNGSKNQDEPINPIARIGDFYLEKEALTNVIPKDLSETDSILYANAFINNWAKEKLLLDKANLNINDTDKEAIHNLVVQYKNDILINKYKEAVVKQELDTLITADEIATFYKKHQKDFLLNEDIIQFKYVNFNKSDLDLNKIKKLLKSNKTEDSKALQDLEMSFNKMNLNDSIWYKISSVYDEIPNFYPELKEKLLKKTKIAQLENSLTVSLVAVKAIKQKKDIAPLSFEKETIRQILLHKRKLELLKKIEKDLLEDAIINKKFETYK